MNDPIDNVLVRIKDSILTQINNLYERKLRHNRIPTDGGFARLFVRYESIKNQIILIDELFQFSYYGYKITELKEKLETAIRHKETE